MTKERIFSAAETWSEYFLYGIVFFTPLGHAGAFICLGFLGLCFAVRKILRPDFTFLKGSECLWLLLFFLFCGLSLINSGPYLQKSLWALLFKWGGYLVVFLFFREAMTDPIKRKRIGWVILATAAIIGIDSLVQFFTGTDLFYARPILEAPYYQAITATFKNYNDLASYLGVVTLIALAMTVAATQKLRWILWVLTMTLEACFLLTFSRGAWLGFFAGLLLMVIISRQWKALLPVIILAIVAISLNASLAMRIISSLSLTISQQAGDHGGRSELWNVAFQMIRENPFLGKGLGTFMDYCGQRVPLGYGNYAHNCYLQIWAESGIFSLVAFLSFVGIVLGKALKAFKRKREPLLLGLLCGIFAFLIHSSLDTQLYSVSQSFLFWSMLGVLAAAAQDVPVSPITDRSGPPLS